MKTGGRVKKVLVTEDDSIPSLNMKNAFVSLFQFQTTSKENTEVRIVTIGILKEGNIPVNTCKQKIKGSCE